MLFSIIWSISKLTKFAQKSSFNLPCSTNFSHQKLMPTNFKRIHILFVQIVLSQYYWLLWFAKLVDLIESMFGCANGRKKCYLEIFGNLLMEKISVFDGKNHHKKIISKFDFSSKIHKIKGISSFDCNYPINICTVWFPLKS